MPYPIAVVDDDAKTRARLAMQLGEDRAVALANLDALDDKYPPGTPAVVVIGPSMMGRGGFDVVEELTKRRPEVGLVLLVSELTTDVLQHAMRAGVRDVLSAPFDADQLGETVQRVGLTLRPATPKVTAGTEIPGHRGRVITVFSTKGGSGKSVIAANLAVALKKRTPGKVILVDADLQFGDVAVMLKITPQHTIVDAVNARDRIDGTLMQSLLAEHRISGVEILPAPVEPAFADQISGGDMTKIIGALRTIADYIVVDTPAYFNDVVLALLDDSDDIVLVAGMDIPNIKNVKVGLSTLRLLNTPISKIKLVLNRANSKVKLDVAEVEKALQLKADCLVPSDIIVPQSVNKGLPAILEAPKSPVSRAIEQLAEDLMVAAGDEHVI